MTSIEVSASIATETTTGVERGLDVSVTVTIDGRDIEGEVTLVPREDGSPGYASWGSSPDFWVSGGLLRELEALPGEDFRAALAEIESAAAKECAEFSADDAAATVYTYNVYDGNPSTSGVDAWYDDGREIEADSVEEAIEAVRDKMEIAAAGCRTADGYAVGDVIYGHVWDADGTIVGTPTYTLTAEDLGVEGAGVEEMAAALKHIADVTVRDGRGRISDYAPDSSEPPYDGETEPGSAWDEECDRLLAEVREALPPGWTAEWLDDDIVIERS